MDEPLSHAVAPPHPEQAGAGLDLERLFRIMLTEKASDLIIKTGSCPAIRVDGRIRFISDQKITPTFSQEVLLRILDDVNQETFFNCGEVDVAFEMAGVGRFRANVYRQCGHIGCSLRHVKDDVPTLRDLNLPAEQLERLGSLQRGLVLATGVAGSGKSTTLAAMVQFINMHFEKHIITVEDPIEFMYHDRKSVVTQREVGGDTMDFHSALKHIVRQTPDVILIGEMRDKETMEAALAAAETGHLVFSTLHTVNAIQTVERIISFFPPHQHELIRQQLSMVLEGVISLRLLQMRDTFGRIPAVELMLATPTVREILSEGRTKELARAIYEGADYFGTQTFNQSLVKLYKSGSISYEDALASADNPDELKLEIRGISKGGKADFDFDY
ncbi:MAG: type IV pilus twitching motility protein PilT [Planctomycetota bacterium]|jgi:twitching motility protein PilT